jgi:uncharacterized protein YggE
MLIFLPSFLWAAEPDQPRLVTVTGTADVKVVPDQVILTLGVETLNLDVNKARAENDGCVKKVFKIASEHGVETKHVRTDHVSIQPKRERRRGTTFEVRDEFVGFEVRQTIQITLEDISNYEAVLSSILEAGVNYIHNIEFRSTEYRRFKDQARALAIKAAEEKATALAGALGERIGKPHSITENWSRRWSSFGSWWGTSPGAFSNVAVSVTGGGSETVSSIAPGQILMSASVTVSFELQ